MLSEKLFQKLSYDFSMTDYIFWAYNFDEGLNSGWRLLKLWITWERGTKKGRCGREEPNLFNLACSFVSRGSLLSITILANWAAQFERTAVVGVLEDFCIALSSPPAYQTPPRTRRATFSIPRPILQANQQPWLIHPIYKYGNLGFGLQTWKCVRVYVSAKLASCQVVASIVRFASGFSCSFPLETTVTATG